MPVDVLIVEGNLDSEILAAVFQGAPVVRRGGSKNSLKPQARYEREHNNVAAGYLRDRDFDYEPPDDCNAAVVDSEFKNSPLGWRWSRHEIESYLLDPMIVERAIDIAAQEWAEAIVAVASRIRWYQIARWTVGQLRRNLPPQFELETRPAGLNELQLPPTTEELYSREWCLTSILEFAGRIEENMSADNVEAALGHRSTLLSEGHLSDVARVLIWCSGKDLLAGLSDDVLRHTGFSNSGELRAALRDWVRDNAEEAVGFLPEWQDLISHVRSDHGINRRTGPP